MKTRVLLRVFVAIMLVGVYSCSKDKNAKLVVKLTDAPADYNQVLIDIQDVQINSSEKGEGNWQSLTVQKRVYNLLDFRNGMDTLLGSIELPAGTISQMRLVLGSNNKVVKDGKTYDLSTPSALQSGLKFNIHAELTEGITYQLWIDFDAARSIVEKGNGNFSLKPVIRTFTKATSGAIKGIVSPVAALPYVEAILNGDTLGTIAGEDGKFVIRGVSEGTYKVIFLPKEGFTEKTVENVNVKTGVVTDMGTVAIN